MDFTLGIYEKAMPGYFTWRKKFESAAKAGYDTFQISIDETDEKLARLDWSAEEKKELTSAAKHFTLPIESICLSGHRRFPLGSHFPEIRERSMDIMLSAIEFASDCEIPLIQLAGYDVFYDEKSDLDTKQYFLENLAVSADAAEKAGVILAFETMENDFMNSVEKAMYYVNMIKSPSLLVYPDSGNLTNAGVCLDDDLSAGFGALPAVHLKETLPGVFRNLRFGEGHVDFAKIISICKHLGVRRFTAEFWYRNGTDCDEELRYAHDYLWKWIN